MGVIQQVDTGPGRGEAEGSCSAGLEEADAELEIRNFVGKNFGNNVDVVVGCHGVGSLEVETDFRRRILDLFVEEKFVLDDTTSNNCNEKAVGVGSNSNIVIVVVFSSAIICDTVVVAVVVDVGFDGEGRQL